MSPLSLSLLSDSRTGLSSLLVAISFACVACMKTESVDPRTEAPLVRVATIEIASAGSRSFTGTVAAQVQSDLGFRVSGKVLARLVDAGQSVRRGEPLMRIDPADLKLAVAAQEQQVAAARARAQQTANDESRLSDLLGTGAVSTSAHDQAKAAADAAQAQFIAAEAQADSARNARSYTELVADNDGVVMETLAEPGQVVSAGQAVVRLAHAGHREAVIQLPETLRPATGSVARAMLYGNDGGSVVAKLRQLSDAADRVTRTFEARYVLEGELASAPLGATVTVQIPDQAFTTKSDLEVPISALIDTGHGPGLWVVSGDPEHVSWKPVAVRGLDSQRARISGDLQPGDHIVALGAHLLSEGDRVRVAGQTPPASVVASTADSHP